MFTFLQQIILGLVNGMVFALIALGYTMVYGILELINFAHGDLFMLASFLALTLVGLLDLDGSSGAVLVVAIPAIIAACVVFAGGLNWLVDRLVYRPLRGAPKLAPLVSAIGVSFMFMNLGLFWGGLPLDVFGGGTTAAAPKGFPNLLPSENLLGDAALRITVKDLTVVASSLAVMLGLFLFVTRTRLGKAMRATAQNRDAARLMGIDVDRAIAFAFGLGGALAGIGGFVYLVYFTQGRFDLGFRIGLFAFTAAVLGGIGNILGAALGGYLIGFIENYNSGLTWHAPGPSWTESLVFILLILILVFRPHGLLGESLSTRS